MRSTRGMSAVLEGCNLNVEGETHEDGTWAET